MRARRQSRRPARNITARRQTRRGGRAATTSNGAKRAATRFAKPRIKKSAAFSVAQLKMFHRLLIAERIKLVDEIKTITKGASKSPREASGDLHAAILADALRRLDPNVLGKADEQLDQHTQYRYGLHASSV